MKKKILAVVFLSSFSTSFYEIILLRIFSFKLDYHFASLIIGVSIFGIVIGSLTVFLKKRVSFQKPESLVLLLSILFPLSFFLFSVAGFDSMKIFWDRTQILRLLLSIFFLTLPFFAYGLLIANFLRDFKFFSHLVYGSDLLGFASGALSAPFILGVLRPETCVSFLFVLLFLLALFFRLGRGNIFRESFLLLPILLFSLYPLFSEVKSSEFKSMNVALRMPGARLIAKVHGKDSRVDVLESPVLRYAPGLSLRYSGKIPAGIALAVDGEILGVFYKELELSDEFINSLSSFAPYVIKTHPESVLIVGLRDGLGPILARASSARSIHVIEKDEAILRFAKSFFRQDSPYSKGLIRGNVREWVTKNKETYDLIIISRLTYFPSGTFGFSEDYETTVEALASYIDALKEDGILFIQIFNLPPPRYEIRIFNNLRYALESTKIRDLSSHLLIFKTWDTWGFLVKKNGLTAKEIRSLEDFFSKNMFQISFPGTLSSREELFLSLGLQKAYAFDVRPTFDSRPFFNHFLRLSRIGEILGLTGKGYIYLIHEGLSLYLLTLFLFLLVSSTLIPVSVFARPKNKGRIILYFATIGFAFMFLEITLLHALILNYASPISSFSSVVSQLLVGAGIGSILSIRLSSMKAASVLVLFLAGILASILFFDFRILRYFLILLGFPMGFFFPLGLRRLAQDDQKVFPFAYAINGATSVIASPLATLIAISLDLTVVLFISFLLYLGAFIMLMPFLHPFRASSREAPPSQDSAHKLPPSQ